MSRTRAPGSAGEGLPEEEAEGDGNALAEGVNDEGHLPLFTRETLKDVTVCVHDAPPVPAVKPRKAEVAFIPPFATPPRKSAKFTVMRCVKMAPVGVARDARMAQPQASYETLTNRPPVTKGPKIFAGSKRAYELLQVVPLTTPGMPDRLVRPP
jgi:hypothetical protein